MLPQWMCSVLGEAEDQNDLGDEMIFDAVPGATQDKRFGFRDSGHNCEKRLVKELSDIYVFRKAMNLSG